jgi:tetratricopeptide (TPR) repeat protein
MNEKFHKIVAFVQEELLDDALHETERIERTGKLKNVELLECTLLKSYITTLKGDATEGLRLADQALVDSQKSENDLLVVDAIIAKGKALSTLVFSGEKVNDQFQTCLYLVERGEGLLSTIHFTQPSDRGNRAICLKRFRTIFLVGLEQRDLFLKTSRELIILCEEFDNKKILALTLQNLASYFLSRSGEHMLGFEYYQKAIDCAKKAGDKHNEAQFLNNTGFFHLKRGELDSAVPYLRQSLAIFKKTNDDSILWPLQNLGACYHAQGEFEQAHDLLTKSLTISEKSDERNGVACALYYLISLTIDTKSREEAQTYYQKANDLFSKSQDKFTNQWLRLAQIKYLKASSRLKNKVKAQELIQQIIDDESSMYVVTVEALLDQCELLLFEMKTSGDEELLQEVKQISVNLVEITQKNNFFSLLVNTRLLQAQCEMVDGNLQKAMDLLLKAQSTAKEHNLHQYIVRVDSERKHFEQELEKWRTIIRNNVALQERLDKSNLDNYVKDALKVVSFNR